MSLKLTYGQVASHSSKKDLYVVIHDKVYDVTKFIDEHPGGEEVLTDVGGQDATEAFEDVGHSDEARELLSGLAIGDLERTADDPSPRKPSASAPAPSSTTGTGIGLYAALIVGGLAAFAAYKYTQAASESKA
ncbi:MAG: hypothetical protein M1818_006039 [Claussenomyces sp. TS43310]|nr:MAG: hypothetical protein M1818_006039 [Claussenomyces sp. TS43310]